MIEKKVEAGMRECRVIPDGEEIRVEFDECFDVYAVDNLGMNDICVSFYHGRNAGDDGVKAVPAGRRGVISCAVNSRNVIYISGKGTADISAGYSSSFICCQDKDDGMAEGTGNPVVLNGLQRNVPFNEIAVSGKNLFVPKPGYALYGGITAGFRLRETNNAFSHVAKIRNNTDYTIKSYSDGNRMNVILFKNDPYTLAKGDDFKRLLWQTTPPIEIREITFNSEYYNYAVLTIASEGSDIDVIVKDAQLEYGRSSTDYMPPVAGQDMVLNVNGTDYSIMPDTNPYTVPVDITQADGTNIISVDNNDAVISVNANRINPQIAKIYEKIGQLELAVITSGGMINV